MQIRNQSILILVFLISIGLLLLNPVQTWGTTTGTLNIRVSSGDDDAEEDVSDGDMDRGSTDLELIHENEDQIVGIRFQNITIPQGSTITNAYIVFTTDETSNGDTDLSIWGEKHSHTAVFSSSTNDISSRPKTAATISWNNIPAWGTEHEESDAQRAPDLTTIVQEIVDQAAWISGNAMVFIFEGSGSRTAESYNGSSSMAPLLHIE